MSNKPKANKTKSAGKDRKHDRLKQERDLEAGLEDTFPASDAVAITEPVVDIVKNDRKK